MKAVAGDHLVVLFKRPHRVGVLDGQPIGQASRDHGLDFHGQPVDPLALADHVAGVAAVGIAVGGLGGVAVLLRVGLPDPFLLHAPDIQPPTDVVGDPTLNLASSVCNAERVVVALLKSWPHMT